MTEREAIKELKQNIEMPFGSNISNEVSKLAIKALEEIQKYQAIGTVEKFLQLSEQFKPHVTDKTSCTERHCNKCDQYRKENEKYHEIGTVEEWKKRYAKLKEYEELGTPNEIRAKLCFLTTYKRADSDGRFMLILDKNGYCEELGGLHIDEIRKRCLEREEKKD